MRPPEGRRQAGEVRQSPLKAVGGHSAGAAQGL